jgi:UDP-N-acetylglucosamine 2-epimerase
MTTMIGLGTRPELIRLFHTVKAVKPDYLFWTGQNFAPNLSTEIIADPRFEGVYDDMVMHSPTV